MRVFLTFFLLIILTTLFQGCGQKGPLYMPDEPDPSSSLVNAASMHAESAFSQS